MNQKQLMSEVYIHGFGRDDAALFLDTHPDCKQALSFFRECADKYKNAVAELAAAGCPLFQSDAADSCSWKWLDEPWPWEGGCR